MDNAIKLRWRTRRNHHTGYVGHLIDSAGEFTMADTQNSNRRSKQQSAGARRGRSRPTGGYKIMANTNGAGQRAIGIVPGPNADSSPISDNLANAISPRSQERTGGAATMNHFNRPSGPTLSAFVTHSESLPQDQIAPTGQESSTGTHGSPRRLNPAFVAWLMGAPWWWTNPALTSCVRSEMESYRCRLQQRLSCSFGAQESGSNRRVA